MHIKWVDADEEDDDACKEAKKEDEEHQEMSKVSSGKTAEQNDEQHRKDKADTGRDRSEFDWEV